MSLSKRQKKWRFVGALRHKVECPDCGAAVPLGDLPAESTNQTIECPRCSAANPSAKWKVRTKKHP